MKKQASFAEFCFFCNEWVFDYDEWDSHCRDHFRLDDFPEEVGWGKIDRNLVPGFCPVCFWNEDLTPAERLRPLCTQAAWEGHVITHNWERVDCPDPRCKDVFDTFDKLWNHMDDIHRVRKGILGGHRTKRRLEQVVPDSHQSSGKHRRTDDAVNLDNIIFEFSGPKGA